MWGKEVGGRGYRAESAQPRGLAELGGDKEKPEDMPEVVLPTAQRVPVLPWPPKTPGENLYLAPDGLHSDGGVAMNTAATSSIWLSKFNFQSIKIKESDNFGAQSHWLYFKCSPATCGQWLPCRTVQTQTFLLPKLMRSCEICLCIPIGSEKMP